MTVPPGWTVRVVSRLARLEVPIVMVVLAPAARCPDERETVTEPRRLARSEIDQSTGPPSAVSVIFPPSKGVSSTVVAVTDILPVVGDAGGVDGGLGGGVVEAGGGAGDGPGAGDEEFALVGAGFAGWDACASTATAPPGVAGLLPEGLVRLGEVGMPPGGPGACPP